MTTKRLIGTRMPAILCLLAWGVTPALARDSPEKDKPREEPARVSETISAANPSGGGQEAIKVHGYWVIEVHNADGTLVERREFANRLVGASVIPRILARKAQNGGLAVSLGRPGSPCLGVGLAEPDFPLVSGLAVSRTLTVAAPTGPQAGQLILFGSATVVSECSADTVGTIAVLTIPGSSAPVLEVLTEALLPGAPIVVTQGQVFTVSVTLTFS